VRGFYNVLFLHVVLNSHDTDVRLDRLQQILDAP
jgi:hypothetical protein